MNAIELLEKQHRKVEALFKKLESGRSATKSTVVELADQLAAHMAIEQEIFYPAIGAIDPDLVSESFEEHSLAELAIKRLLATNPRETAFKARVTAAKELIEHHVKEEEEELFVEVENALSSEELDELGARMKERFAEVYEAGYASVVPSVYTRTSADVARRGLRLHKSTRRAA